MKKIISSLFVIANLIAFNTAYSTSLEEVFTSIYEQHAWGGYPETYSGSGSTLKQTIKIRKLLSSLFETLEINTVLDAPCGDFNWMKEIDLSKVHYIGMDIVKDLIANNQKMFASSTVSFIHGDVCNGPLPKVDLVFCRDLFLHLKYQDIKNVLTNFKKSGATYLMASTYANAISNTDRDEVNSGFRPINLELPPFNLPKPTVLITEDINIKYLGLWNISDIPNYKN